LILAKSMYGYFRNTIQFYFTRSLISIFILFSAINFSQTKTNLEVFYSLTDSLVNKIGSEISERDQKILLTLNLGDSYTLFSNNIISGLKKYDKNITTFKSEDQVLPEINLNLTVAEVKYEDAERNGWFGDYYVKRKIFIEGDFLYSSSEQGLNNYYFAAVDSVKVDEIKTLENDSFPFSKGKIPAEPFFSSLWEPVIAIGVAAVTVILFFSVRSK
jgi:hypothetical protein